MNGNEQSNMAVEDGDIDPVSELLCMAIKKKLAFPSIARLLKDVTFYRPAKLIRR